MCWTGCPPRRIAAVCDYRQRAETSSTCQHLLDQRSDIGLSLSGRVPERGVPLAVRFREARINRVESVCKERVRHRPSRSVREGDRYLPVLDDLVREDRIYGPVPIWGTEIRSRLGPALRIGFVALGDLHSFRVEHLLCDCYGRDYVSGQNTDLEESHVGPVPGWEEGGSMGAIPSPLQVGRWAFRAAGFVPLHVRQPVDAGNLEEGGHPCLVVAEHGRCGMGALIGCIWRPGKTHRELGCTAKTAPRS
ncbi:unnamed protein product [Mycena citricolor]|uniref:Uncharacterized protein n=1 Tax=Mycena citricolor TaxID=2018698 RepID=A0AAD2H8H7_9AGAR|nr:unnamed protein product [Mycena citricolor]